MPQSFIAELVVSHPDLPLAPTLTEISDITVEVEAHPLVPGDSDDKPSVFVSVKGSDFHRFESTLETDHTVDQWQTIIEFTDCRIYQITLRSNSKFITPEIGDLGVHILSIRSAERGWTFRLQAPDKEHLGAYWQYCRDEGVQFDLQQLYSTGQQATVVNHSDLKSQLTDRQCEVARTVTQMGYYESDGASAEAVAAELGITPSTVSTHLRRIIAKLFNQIFSD